MGGYDAEFKFDHKGDCKHEWNFNGPLRVSRLTNDLTYLIYRKLKV